MVKKRALARPKELRFLGCRRTGEVKKSQNREDDSELIYPGPILTDETTVPELKFHPRCQIVGSSQIGHVRSSWVAILTVSGKWPTLG
jgi:hypothetical protein